MADNKVYISCDSAADIPEDIIKKRNIKVLPLIIAIGDVAKKDGEYTSDDVFNYEKTTGKMAKTSAPSIGETQEYFEGLTKDGAAVVHITLSSDMSVTYNNARLAAAECENVFVVDSKNLSSGISLVVLAACEMAEKGMSAQEIAKECDALVGRVDASFILNRLDYIYKGGRCSAVAAFGANVLGIKPCIQVVNGKMGVGKKYRGKLPDALKNYVKDRIADTQSIVGDRVFVTHSDCDEDVATPVIQQLEESGLFKEIIHCNAGCTISCHCGPNCLGILFVRKNDIK